MKVIFPALQIFILTLLLSGCQSPFLVFPGKALSGTELHTTDFAFAEGFRLLKLEVNPCQPYSVYLRTTVINGELYIDAAPGRKWGQLIRQNPQVRIALGTQIYPATATAVTETEITDRFFGSRTVYRLEPRSSANNHVCSNNKHHR